MHLLLPGLALELSGERLLLTFEPMIKRFRCDILVELLELSHRRNVTLVDVTD